MATYGDHLEGCPCFYCQQRRRQERIKRDTKDRVPHMYHCPLDGTQLFESGLGLVICEKCGQQFIPTSDPGWEKEHPGQRMDMLSWVIDVKEGE